MTPRPLLKSDICSAASRTRLISVQLSNVIQLWRLEKPTAAAAEAGVKPVLALQVSVPDGHNVLASALSDDGTLLAFSAANIGTRVLRLQSVGRPARLVPSRVAGTKVIGLTRSLAFTPNGSALLGLAGNCVKVRSQRDAEIVCSDQAIRRAFCSVSLRRPQIVNLPSRSPL